MFRQKYFCVILIVMMFFVIASGGCGGGSSNSSSRSNPNNPSPDNPSPDNPNPVNPNPDNPNQDNPETEYDISVLAGTWVASNGTAAMTDADDNVDLENFDLTIQEDGTHFEFSNIQLNGNTASIDMYGHTHWEYRSGSRTGKTHGMDYDLGKTRQFQHVSGNTWRCVNTAPYPNQTINPEETITITITSPTTVEIEEKRNFEVWNNRKQAMDEGVYQWTASFTLTKEDELN